MEGVEGGFEPEEVSWSVEVGDSVKASRNDSS